MELTHVVALSESEGGPPLIRFHSIQSSVLPLVEKSIRTPLHGLPLLPERFIYFSEIFERRRAVFVPDQVVMAERLLPDVPRWAIEHAARLVGTSVDAPAIYLPLVAGEKVLGLLDIWGPGLREEDIPTFAVFAAQLAAALEVARLHEQVKSHHIEEQAALLKLSQALLSETEAQAMVDVAVRVAAEALRAEFASASLVEPQGKRYSVRAALGMPPEFLQNSQSASEN